MQDAARATAACHIDARSGWIREARRVDSPNCDERPRGCAPELIVVHGISLPPGKYGGQWIDALFTNTLPAAVHEYFGGIRSLRVSAHVVIARSGALTQFVPFHKRAWHAGESCYGARSACNDFSVGIELEGTDDSPYAPPQYEALCGIIASLRSTYSALAAADIVGHCDIAPGRKTDPGPAFDWTRLRMLLGDTARRS